ncbi:MAG: ATP phosphoribosyltransferase regulatory subunit [Proteobacteria bacterium]|nr:ATP phosphoribosyltransferase regulatory subunit [Pseudomonadota bacterium]
MTEPAQRALLPAGLRDILPPEAEFEAAVVERLMATFGAQGYERVKPPLVEFEDSLLAGSGAAMGPHTFRLMDPVSQRMMAVRADMTLQIARIATSRLRNAPRPLRLSYAGQVLRVKGDDLRPERQFGQVGVELIGTAAAAADAEAVLLAAAALAAVGVSGLSIDLSSPRLAPAVVAAHGASLGENKPLRDALDRKDAAEVSVLGGPAAAMLAALLRAAGPAASTLAALAKLALPPEAAAEARRVGEVVALIRGAAPELRLTIDPVENRNFEYHTGLCFTLFADRVRGMLGRGGRYVAGESHSPGRGEPATGFTLFTDSLLRALPAPAQRRRLYLPSGTPAATAAKWRGEGWATVAGLDPVADARAEARRLACSHVLTGDRPQAVE